MGERHSYSSWTFGPVASPLTPTMVRLCLIVSFVLSAPAAGFKRQLKDPASSYLENMILNSACQMIHCGWPLGANLRVYLYTNVLSFYKKEKAIFPPSLYFPGLLYLNILFLKCILFCSLKSPAAGRCICVQTRGGHFLLT